MKKSILFLAAIVAVGCGASGPGVDTPITFKLTPKAGETYSYIIDTDTGTSKTQMDISVLIQTATANKITSVAQLNTMLYDDKQPPAEILEPMKQMRIYNEMDSTGKVLSSRTESGPEISTAGVGANVVSFPATPIKVGDTWEGTTTTFGEKGVHAKYRLASIDEIDGKRIARIEVTPELPKGTHLEGPVVTQVEVSNGMLYSMSMKSITENPQGDRITTMEMKRKAVSTSPQS